MSEKDQAKKQLDVDIAEATDVDVEKLEQSQSPEDERELEVLENVTTEVTERMTQLSDAVNQAVVNVGSGAHVENVTINLGSSEAREAVREGIGQSTDQMKVMLELFLQLKESNSDSDKDKELKKSQRALIAEKNKRIKAAEEALRIAQEQNAKLLEIIDSGVSGGGAKGPAEPEGAEPVPEPDAESDVEKTERQITEMKVEVNNIYDSRFNFESYQTAILELARLRSEKEAELKGLYGDGYDHEGDSDYQKLAEQHEELAELLHNMQTQKELIIKAEIVVGINEIDGDDDKALHDLTEVLHEISISMGGEDFEIPESLQEALDEQKEMVKTLETNIIAIIEELKEKLGIDEPIPEPESILEPGDEIPDGERPETEFSPEGDRTDEFITTEVLEAQYGAFRDPDYEHTESDIMKMIPYIGKEKALALLAKDYETSETELAELYRKEVEEIIEDVVDDGNTGMHTLESLVEYRNLYGHEIFKGLPIGEFKVVVIRDLKKTVAEGKVLLPKDYAYLSEFFSEEELQDNVPELAGVLDEKLEEQLELQRSLEDETWEGDPELKPFSGLGLLEQVFAQAKIFGKEKALAKISPDEEEAIRAGLKEYIEFLKKKGKDPGGYLFDAADKFHYLFGEGFPGGVPEPEVELGEETPEASPEEENLELDEARKEYLKALEEKGGFLSSKRRLGVFGYSKEAKINFEATKKIYEYAIKEEQKAKLEAKKAELLTSIEDTGNIPEGLFAEYLSLLDSEEAKIDEFATSEEKTRFQKFKQVWRKTSKARLIGGLGLAGVGIAAAIPALGLVAAGAFFGTTAFMAIRGVMGGAGSYMAAEAHLDTRSEKLGQKGLIDEVSKMGIFRGLNVFKRGKANQEVIDKIVADAASEDGENVFAKKHSKEELGAELARLRALSLDKGVTLNEAGRFGVSQSKLIDLLRKTYHEKLKEEFVESSKIGEEGEALSEEERAELTLNTLNESISAKVQEEQKRLAEEISSDRKKKIVRHSAAAGIGFISAAMIGTGATSSIINKIRGVDASVPTETPEVDADSEGGVSALDKFGAKLGRKIGELNERYFAGTESSAADSAPEVADLVPAPEVSTEAEDTGSWLDRFGGKLGKGIGRKVVEMNNPDTADVVAVDTSSVDTAGTQEVPAATAAADTTSSAAEVEAPAGAAAADVDQLPKDIDIAATENVESIAEVAKGDTVWGIAKNELMDRLGEEKWAELGEAKQTFMIDAVKDKIVADPGTYGIDGDADILKAGTDINIGQAVEDAGALDGLQEAAGNLSAEGMENIVNNNEAIGQAAKAGIRITSENVDQVAAEIRENGLEFLTKDGVVHEWTNGGFPVDKVGEDFVNAMSGEKIPADQLESITNRAGEGVADNAVSDSAEAAGERFSDQALQEIMESNEPAHIEEYLKDYIADKGWPHDKSTVFLSSLRDGAGKINNNLGGGWTQEVGGMSGGDLDGVMENWDKALVKDSFDELKEVDPKHWTPIKIGEHYHFAQKVNVFLGRDSYVLDIDGDLSTEGVVKVSSSDMESAFETGTTALIDNPAGEQFHEIGGVSAPEVSIEAIEASPLSFHESIPANQHERLQAYYQYQVDTYNQIVDKFENLYEPKFGENPDFPKFTEDIKESLDYVKGNMKAVEDYSFSGENPISENQLEGDLQTGNPVDEKVTPEGNAGYIIDGGIENEQYFQDTLSKPELEDATPQTPEPAVDNIPEVEPNISIERIEAAPLSFHESISSEEQVSLQETYQFAVDEHNSYIDQYEDYKALHGNAKDFGIFAKNAESYLNDSEHTISKLNAYISTGTGKQHINFDYLGPYEGDAESTPEFVAGMSLSGTLEASSEDALPNAESNASAEPSPVEPTSEPVTEVPNENVSAVLQDLSKAYFKDGKSYTMDDILNLEDKQLAEFEDTIKKTVAVLELKDDANVGKLEAYKHILDKLRTDKV